MRVMTYNILTGGLDEDGTDRFEPLVSLIRRQAPDILTLNECNHFERDGYRRFYAFERALGMRGFLGIAPSGFHVAVFARNAEFVQHEVMSDWVQHAILRVKMRVSGEPFTVVSAHLCPFGGEIRLSEAQYLAGSTRDHEKVLVAGDMNALSPHDVSHYDADVWAPRRKARHWLSGGGGLDTRAIALMEDAGLIDLARRAELPFTPTALTPLRDSPAFPYAVRIDYLFATPSLAAGLSAAAVIGGELADAASDHYAVVADL
jgi:endonuclease/exonuclease/phosphatase family metal-dependent hydrolase